MYILLFRIHQGQLSSNQVLLPVMDKLRQTTSTQIGQARVSSIIIICVTVFARKSMCCLAALRNCHYLLGFFGTHCKECGEAHSLPDRHPLWFWVCNGEKFSNIKLNLHLRKRLFLWVHGVLDRQLQISRRADWITDTHV